MNDPNMIIRVDERLIALAARVSAIESLIRWLGLAVGAALVGAVLNLVLR
jgi:hypothetical protein